MAVVARVYVQEMTRFAYNPEHCRVTLNASTRGTENKEWAAATPSATFTMNINNGAASKFFEEAFNTKQDIHLTFDLAPDPTDV